MIKKVFTSLLSFSLLGTSTLGNPISILAQEEMEEELVEFLEDTEVPLDSARAINVNTNISGNLSNDNDSKWYSFTLSSPGKVNFEFSHPYIERDVTY